MYIYIILLSFVFFNVQLVGLCHLLYFLSEKVKGQRDLFFILVCLQDKALAALAIEDKKRQYAAAEKQLEDVLQSALASSE